MVSRTDEVEYRAGGRGYAVGEGHVFRKMISKIVDESRIGRKVENPALPPNSKRHIKRHIFH